MQVSISEFHNHYRYYFDAALNGELVWVKRGGVLYRLTVELPTGKQLPEPKDETDDDEEE